jgi:superfamily II DNA or RNA helicase
MKYLKILDEILSAAESWDIVYERLTKISKEKFPDNWEKGCGLIFEEFAKLYFEMNPTEKDDYEAVWLYSEVPDKIKKNLRLPDRDKGVDIVLQNKVGGFRLVQCKFRVEQDATLYFSQDKISNILAHGNDPALTYVVFTNASNIDEDSQNMKPNFKFYNYDELARLSADTLKMMAERAAGKIPTPPEKRVPRNDQKSAIEKAVTHFNEYGRGQIILPCGAGKTLVGLWIKEELKAKLTLVLVPSLALLRQVKDDWAVQKKESYLHLCVCSDDDIDQGNEDQFVTHTYEITGNVSTDPEKIREFLTSSESDKVVFSTYQSLPKIVTAIAGKQVTFDLAICDEAHRTAGVSDARLFGLIHHDKDIRARKRLYMTATPRVISKRLKNKLQDTMTYDMSDHNIYGKEIFRLSYKEVIDSGVLVDYRIIAIGVGPEMHDKIHDRSWISKTETIDDYANNIALNQVMQEHNLHHAVTFHSKIEGAERFQNRHKQQFASTSVEAFSVSGKTPVSQRKRSLREFQIAKNGVISNARCLIEGVDIPEIDTVYFSDPKRSKLEVVQATGRALRKDKENTNKIGHIVVPIFHASGDEIDKILEGSRFENLISVVRALCDQDERLEEEITYLATGKGPTTKRLQTEGKFGGKDRIILENFEEKLKEAIFNQIIEKSANSWEVNFLTFKQFLDENKGEYPGRDHELYGWVNAQRTFKSQETLSPDRLAKLEEFKFIWDQREENWNRNFEAVKAYMIDNNNKPPTQKDPDKRLSSLGVWCNQQRKDYRNGRLLKPRIDKFDSIKFDFNPEETDWQTRFKTVKAYWDKHQTWENLCDKEISGWLKTQVGRMQKNSIEAEKIDRLNNINIDQFINLPTTTEKRWEEQFQKVKQFKETNNRFPSSAPGKSSENDEKAIGLWCASQKEKFRRDRLTPDEIQKLRDIGFDFTPTADQNAAKFEEKLQKLKAFLEIHKRSPTMSDKVDGEKQLAQFVITHKNWYLGKLKKYGKYDPERYKKFLVIGIDLGKTS